jgi:hypothetical protein
MIKMHGERVRRDPYIPVCDTVLMDSWQQTLKHQVCGFIYLDRVYHNTSLNVQFITDSFYCLKSVQIL